jgi:hypothetical protein
MISDTLTRERDGAQKIQSALAADDNEALARVADETTSTKPGARLRACDARLAPVIGEHGVVANAIAALPGKACKPVRVFAFDKNEHMIWSLPWHQNRTLAVRERREVDGFGPWSVKQGLQHVAPLTDILARMFTARLYIDQCDAENARLRIALGSHLLGLVSTSETSRVIAASKIYDCLAQPGDVWLHKRLILPASESTKSPTRRRVVQVDYADFELPDGLQWLE